MIKKYQLRNKMKVLLVESHKSPVISVQIWVKTGSADEKKGEEGLSHFIEHLVFKGTKKFKVGELASSIETAGGDINAYTSFDQTVFHVTLSSRFLDTGLDVISELVAHPLFDEKEIDLEREVVCEEIKKNADEPGRQSSRLLFETVYKDHPYSIPVIGYEKIIRKVSKKKIVEYFNSRYVPSNMTLVVAGDFREKEIKPKIKERFEFEPHKLRKVVRKKDKKQLSPRLSVKKVGFEENYLNIAWKIPPPSHKDIPAIEILGMVLGQGDSSRLVKAARIDKALVTSVGAGTYTPRDGGFFVTSATLNEKNLKEFLSVLSENLQSALVAPPSPEEFQKSIVNFESDEFYGLETVDELARKAGYYDNLMGDPHYFKKFMKDVLAVKPADIVRIARKYFSPKTMAVTLMSNADAGAKKTLQAWIKEYTKMYNKACRAPVSTNAAKIKKRKLAWSESTMVKAKIEKIVLPSGATVLLRPSFETPTISARAAFCGGVRAEPAGKDGLVELVANTWLGGTDSLREEEIYQKHESIASSLSAFGGRNTIGLSLDTLVPFEKEALDLFMNVLNGPVFPQPVVEREKTMMLEAIKAKEDYPSQIVSQQFYEGLFGPHPYAKELSGKANTVAGLTGKDVETYWKSVAHTKNLWFAVAGHFDEKLWREQLAPAGQTWAAGPRRDALFAHPELSQPKMLFTKLAKEQTHIIYGFKGLTQTDPDRFKLQLIQSVLAGLGGRLFMELREKASLAYSVSPIRMEGIDTGYFGAYIACSPNKTEQAIGMLKKEFEKLMELPISSGELDRARRFVVGRHDIELQKNSSICAAMLFDDLYGNSYEEAFKFSKLVEGITADDLRRMARKIFEQFPVISVVGPAAPKSVGKSTAEFVERSPSI